MRAWITLLVLVTGCGTTGTEMVTPWLRSVRYKEASFDSGGEVHTSVEMLRDGSWEQLEGAEQAIAFDGGRRVALRQADGEIVVLERSGARRAVPSCTGRSLAIAPDGRRFVCFLAGDWPLGFIDGVFYATGSADDTRDTRACRLVASHPDGHTQTWRRVVPIAQSCLDQWDDVIDRGRLEAWNR